ncbi:type I-E CRISPR-associated protein Cas5/CasD [Actinoalloteichus caeruleus]|uniref:type I-E CRISPR-associated protein Cas5/CasD n=1 Tax=Actinoalloteichus cyanogriseus TaxID=2893586 RepID=UPI003AAAC96C
MIASIALCFDAPLQSWGTTARFTIRDTATEPTKSGVVGLLGAALGTERDDTEMIARLAALRMGVRVDREGVMEEDYHVTENVPNTSGGNHRTVVSRRYYLAGALFLVVLETKDDVDLLARLEDAVRSPRYPLFFGRKAFVPARPLVRPGDDKEINTGLGLLTESLETVLGTHPWLETEVSAADGLGSPPLRTLVDCPPTSPHAELRHDHPVSFVQDARRFLARTVEFGTVPLLPSMIHTSRSSEGEPCS